ncbi:serine/threonine-protein kinase [Actinoplanes sp. NEAU-A12]|uniref:Serine/threonine-protein kinase n=1 Tax=Actinoplanes sandaracinus TaxID=3045177 RepID=A0ABT6WR32_9ACTN|nr:serine/threonine-protein kinase [Actinoplanes sandaracinus]MDI6102156.1 serine/threonine-protein kinase [Actinoplanes sandaracinus]
MANPLRPTDPRSIGRYRTLSRLGEGGMGSVYLAEDPGGRLVAVKIIRSEYAHEAEFRARFRSEVNRAREVPPFCTAEVLDADPDHVTPYLVVEYVDGPSLNEVVADQGALTGGSLHGVAVGVAAALAAIHGAGVIHRDLKPRNVLFALGTPKVIDFGIARPLEPTSFHTRAQEVVGTLAYMAPERLDPETDRLLTPAVDVFAWGAVVTYAGTGRTPFGGDSPAVTAARILTQPPRIGDLPPYLAELVTAALEKEPENRPTAPELLDRLLVSGAPSAPPLPASLRRSAEAAQQSGRYQTGARKRGRRRNVALIGAVTAAAVVAAAGAGAALRERGDRDAPPVTATTPAAAPVVAGPAIFDPLTSDSFFVDASADQGSCTYQDGLRVTAKASSEMTCGDFLKTVFPPTQNLSVRAKLGSDRSCASIWFRARVEKEAGTDAYRVDVCPEEVRLLASTGGGGDVPIASERRATTIGAAHLVQVIVDERKAAVRIDGAPVLSGSLEENSLVSGRVLLGATAPPGGRAVVTFTDARLRSGTNPEAPAVPAFVTGDATLTVETDMVYDKGRVTIAEQAEFITGAEYCRRSGLPENTPKCASRYVSVRSGIKVALPLAAERRYLDFRPDPARCTDPQTRAGTCPVPFQEFVTAFDDDQLSPALLTIRGGEVTTVAKLNVG